MTLLSDTAYHSFIGEVEALNTTTIRRLTRSRRHQLLAIALDQFAKSLPALGDDALIDTYHQAWEDHRAACAEGSDNLSKAYAKSLATEKAMRDRFLDYQGRYRLRYP
jgi:hypothetical protein